MLSSLLARVTSPHLSGALPEPEISKDRERYDYDADDVEHVAHGLPPSCSFTLVASEPSAHWT